MSNYQARFDEAAIEARRLVVNNGGEIRNILPQFYGTDFDRLTKSISSLLERIDKGSVDHAEYLAHSSGNVGDLSVNVIEGIPASLESGASHFVQTTLPTLLLCEERLQKAVGNYYYKVKTIRNRQLTEIQKLAEEALKYRNEALGAKKDSIEIQESSQSALEVIENKKETINAAYEKVGEIRNLVEKLASGDGRGKSLESLKRRAEEKLSSIEDVLANASKASSLASESIESLNSALSEIEEAQKEIETTKIEAKLVMGLSSQAGLANSYLQESRKLARRSYIFTAILYITSLCAAAIAALYVLPSLEHTISNDAGSFLERAIPTTMLRATVLAPLVYVIYFTTRQISSLETLRMDYAEKAAASLAYSGYKGEMSEDGSLLERLRSSLLLKFAEHPERLLRKRPVTDTIKVETPGFSASSVSSEVAEEDE